MRRAAMLGLLGWAVLLSAAVTVRADDEPGYTHREDVVYGRKWGMALTMDVFAPKKDANGAAVIAVMSGGWVSTHDWINPGMAAPYVSRGYAVFAVVHGSQPKFTIPEAIADMQRSVRYIRYHAKDYHIDPDRIGVTGGSAGGHLSLMLGTTGGPGDPKAKDPVDRESSRVEAVACFFPPTDFLNYGAPGKLAIGRGTLVNFRAPFDFHEFDPKTHEFERIADEAKERDIAKQISPIYHITAHTPPTLIVHGDADNLVPIQQAETFVAKCKEAGVPAELVVEKGAGHGGPAFGKDVRLVADWFDKYLGKKADTGK
jgi:acetyl esterase/lipase